MLKKTHQAKSVSPLENILKMIAIKHDPLYPKIRDVRIKRQAEMLSCEVLPTEVNNPLGVDVKAKLEELGCLFGHLIIDDPIFQQVTLPPSWKKMATNDPEWSIVIDEQGRSRIFIFYQDGFISDRVAFMNVDLNLD